MRVKSPVDFGDFVLTTRTSNAPYHLLALSALTRQCDFVTYWANPGEALWEGIVEKEDYWKTWTKGDLLTLISRPSFVTAMVELSQRLNECSSVQYPRCDHFGWPERHAATGSDVLKTSAPQASVYDTRPVTLGFIEPLLGRLFNRIVSERDFHVFREYCTRKGNAFLISYPGHAHI